MTKKTWLVAGLVLLALVVLGLSFYLLKTASRPQVAPTPTPTPPPQAVHHIELIPVVSRNGAMTNLDLWWQPRAGQIPLNTVAVQLTIQNPQGQVKALSSNPNWDQEYRNTSIRIPFDDLINNPDGTVTLKFSAVITAPEPYNFSQKAKLMSLPLEVSPQGTLTFQLDPNLSEGYDKQMGLIAFSLTDTMTAPESL
ncbi:hypothetical protein A2W24_04065 [Microgenomates group bacterium RBG_16_45_19]|nr:MAG: hypothetical protein A2W24_04065 [Microgenomates group bacterium RBG_16_45_19]